MVKIRRLGPYDARPYQEFRLLALRESPTAFSSSVDEESALPVAIIEAHLGPESGRQVFGAEIDARLVGMVGLGRELPRKAAHKARISGVYVDAANRGRGIARQLVNEAWGAAALMAGVRQVTLAVTAGNQSAVSLYESLGFKQFGVEPRSLLIDGVFLDDIHMVRYLPVT